MLRTPIAATAALLFAFATSAECEPVLSPPAMKLLPPPRMVPPNGAPSQGPPPPSGDAALDAYRRGLFDLNDGKYDSAEASLTEAIRIKPDYARAYSNRATIYVYKGKYLQAIRDIDRYIELRPNDITAYVESGQIRAASGDYEGAIRDCTKVLESYPTNRYILGVRARVWAAKGDLDRALADYNSMVNSADNAGPSLQSFALAWRATIQYRRREWALASDDASAAFRLFPTNWRALYIRGLAELKLGQTAPGQDDLANAKMHLPTVAEDLKAEHVVP